MWWGLSSAAEMIFDVCSAPNFYRRVFFTSEISSNSQWNGGPKWSDCLATTYIITHPPTFQYVFATERLIWFKSRLLRLFSLVVTFYTSTNLKQFYVGIRLVVKDCLPSFSEKLIETCSNRQQRGHHTFFLNFTGYELRWTTTLRATLPLFRVRPS